MQLLIQAEAALGEEGRKFFGIIYWAISNGQKKCIMDDDGQALRASFLLSNASSANEFAQGTLKICAKKRNDASGVMQFSKGMPKKKWLCRTCFWKSGLVLFMQHSSRSA